MKRRRDLWRKSFNTPDVSETQPRLRCSPATRPWGLREWLGWVVAAFVLTGLVACLGASGAAVAAALLTQDLRASWRAPQPFELGAEHVVQALLWQHALCLTLNQPSGGAARVGRRRMWLFRDEFAPAQWAQLRRLAHLGVSR